MFVDDVALLKKVEKSVQSRLNAEASWMDAIETFAVLLEDAARSNLTGQSCLIFEM